MVQGIPELEKYLVILMLRDPRDVLVSEYYSIAYSHPAPYGPSAKFAEFVKQKQAARSMTIDEYVINDSERLYRILQVYRRNLLENYTHVYVTTYEEMLVDFDRWLDGLLDRCQLTITADHRKSLVQENHRTRPRNEDVHRHLRKGQSGDHKAKLKSETIEYLNRKFAFILEGYPKFPVFREKTFGG
jgi:hypothetical protein